MTSSWMLGAPALAVCVTSCALIASFPDASGTGGTAASSASSGRPSSSATTSTSTASGTSSNASASSSSSGMGGSGGACDVKTGGALKMLGPSDLTDVGIAAVAGSELYYVTSTKFTIGALDLTSGTPSATNTLPFLPVSMAAAPDLVFAELPDNTVVRFTPQDHLVILWSGVQTAEPIATDGSLLYFLDLGTMQLTKTSATTTQGSSTPFWPADAMPYDWLGVDTKNHLVYRQKGTLFGGDATTMTPPAGIGPGSSWAAATIFQTTLFAADTKEIDAFDTTMIVQPKVPSPKPVATLPQGTVVRTLAASDHVVAFVTGGAKPAIYVQPDCASKPTLLYEDITLSPSFLAIDGTKRFVYLLDNRTLYKLPY